MNSNSKIEVLTDYDIITNKFKYDSETLEWNIIHSYLSLRKLVKNQKLTPYICAKYVVFGGRNEMYADCTEDAWIATADIPFYQPHIKMEEMYEAHEIAYEEDQRENQHENHHENQHEPYQEDHHGDQHEDTYDNMIKKDKI